VAVVASVLLPAVGAWAEPLRGSGSTFAANAIAIWAEGYRRETATTIDYQAVGSGAGIKDIKARRTLFGVSDVPLSVAELMNDDLVQFPIVIGGVVPVVNLGDGEAQGPRLDGPTLAAIFLGEIVRWDDPRILTLNPGRALPGLAIRPAHRGESSGTTFLFTFYLSRVSPVFKQRVGFGKTVEWPVGTAHEGNDGIAAQVARTPGAIGYVEFSRSRQRGLEAVRLKDRSGRWIVPTTESFQRAAASVPWESTPAFASLVVDAPGEGAWPVAGMSFAVMARIPSDTAQAEQALRFFWWAFHNRTAEAEAAGYVPLPPELIGLVETAWARQLKTASGVSVWPRLAASSSAALGYISPQKR
jgi:phosphate transport system substrate-binding protein